MKMRVNSFDGTNVDIFRQMAIDCPLPLESVELEIDVKMENLSPGMDLGVRSTGSRDGYGLPANGADRILNRLLNRRSALGRLDLPTGIIKAIVADDRFKPLSHASQRTSIVPSSAAHPASSR